MSTFACGCIPPVYRAAGCAVEHKLPGADHTCHAIACTRPCPPEYLMCGAHWRMVPAPLKDAVYAHFNPRQCRDVPNRPAPTAAWHNAADLAILAVAEREGTVTPAVAEKMRARAERWLAKAKAEGFDG